MHASEVSSPDAFRKFSSGIDVTPDLLLGKAWDGNSRPMVRDIADLIMHEMLPDFYSVAHLESIGGSYALRMTDIADFTILLVNRRVVVLSGLPLDYATGEEVIDLELASDVFFAYFRGLMLDMAEDLLEDDDESEDRVVSDIELEFVGIPAGGAVPCRMNKKQSNSKPKNWGPQNGTNKDKGKDLSKFVACGTNKSGCGANLKGTISACGKKLAGCGANVSLSGCGANKSACGANFSSSGCGANASVCSVNASKGVCGANASSCGKKSVAAACGANANTCKVNKGAVACGANAAACVSRAAGSACGANVGTCTKKVGVGVCGVNLSTSVDVVSFCIIDFIPFIPFI
jgi:hypothetical protein